MTSEDHPDVVKPSKHVMSMSRSVSMFRHLGRKSSNWSKRTSRLMSGMRVGSILRTWADVSMINFISSQPSEIFSSGDMSTLRRSFGATNEPSSHNILLPQFPVKGEEELIEEFLVNVTPLMNEHQLWGCFYIFPELYDDVYSPVVRVRNAEDVPEIVGGILTRDMITTCLTYLKRTPLLGDFVYIKLNLSAKHLVNIEILQYYKYLVYLDLSSNFLTELSVLSKLLYLQFISVAFNRLNTVLEYETPQWFLTEVHYKYNSVNRIRDISMFWSLTILDLSHNNIKCISGLENLRYLRRLDLSFNHIQRLENLNHLRLLWLDVSYNNISSFEFNFQSGLWTLLHLEYLNLNENNLTSMKVFSGCTRLRELYARNNRFSTLLELAVYMRQLRRLIVLDLRANPVCTTPGYKDVIINTFPLLLNLDAEDLDPVIQRMSKLDMTPDVSMFASRRLLRLLYIEQLSKARVSPYVPPADTTEVPMVILVGYEAVGKGTLARRLATECSSHIERALQHTTASYHFSGHYVEVSRARFDDMLLAGDFLTYSEMDGESYGLSREESFINNGKVKIVTMDLIGALMMVQRGRRPYLILTSCLDKVALAIRQKERKVSRNKLLDTRLSMEVDPLEKSALQVLISGRILITGILNEILLGFPDEKEQSEFVIESECSLLMDSEARAAVQNFAKGFNMIAMMDSETPSLDELCERNLNKTNPNETSLYSLYKESQNTDEFASDVNGHDSYQCSKKSGDKDRSQSKPEKTSSISRPKSVDFTRYVSSTWKGLSGMNSTKSSKSVTFISQDNTVDAAMEQGRVGEAVGQTTSEMNNIKSGMVIEPHTVEEKELAEKQKKIRSLSTKLPWPGGPGGPQRSGSGGSLDDLDLWLAFLIETGLMRTSEATVEASATDNVKRHISKIDDPDFIIQQLEFYHRVTMDDPDEAFIKVKRIIQNVVARQKYLKPMFDIDFANMESYPTAQKKLARIRDQIAPQRLFY